MRKILFAFIITILSAQPSKNDFNKLFIDVAQSGSPCVVTIVTEKTETDPNMFFFGPFDFEDPYQYERKSKSLGSGVIIDANKGYILTNNHVVENAEGIKVILYDKREFDAKIIGTDPPSDLAVIQIETEDLSQAKLGNSDNLQIGEWVVAIGSPFGLHLNHTVTSGIVSAIGRSDVISRTNFENFIQHDAAINPGNSGGALFALDGELIGINTAIATDGFSRSNAGVGFAIPINQAKRVMEDLISGGKVSRGYLGVYIEDLGDNKARALGINNTKGAFLVMIVDDSPADTAGLKEKDVIIAINSTPIENSNQLRNDVSSMRPGNTVVFSIIRNELPQSVSVILGERPSNGSETIINPNAISYDIIGLKVGSNNEGVIILDIDKKSIAYKNNIQKNDIITEIGRQQINSIEDYNEELKKYLIGDTIMLRIIKNGQPRYEAFEIK